MTVWVTNWTEVDSGQTELVTISNTIISLSLMAALSNGFTSMWLPLVQNNGCIKNPLPFDLGQNVHLSIILV